MRSDKISSPAGRRCIAMLIILMSVSGQWLYGQCAQFSSDGPGMYTRTTCGSQNRCALAPGPEHIWAVRVSCRGSWTFSTCGSAFNTSLFLGTTCCSSDIASNDDFCGQSSTINVMLNPGTYYLSVEGATVSDCGPYTLTITGPTPPPNDDCSQAPLIGAGMYTGSTSCAAPDAAPFCGVADASGGGVWYKVAGNGNYFNASLCAGTQFDTRLRVFRGACSSLVCIAGNDDMCGTKSEVEWCSERGVNYFILVHGNGNASGDFTLSLTEGVVGDPEFSGLAGPYCNDAASLNLTAITPGGMFSGAGVSGTLFSPVAAGAGTHVVTHTISAYGCTVTSSRTVVVGSPGDASFTGLPAQLCSGEGTVNLVPAMGDAAFSGPGISGRSFIPSVAGAGTHTVTCTVDQGGCFTQTSRIVTVNLSPDATVHGLPAHMCINDSPVSLVPVEPGGSLVGNGLQGNDFWPVNAGSGPSLLMHTLSANGCTSVWQQEVVVVEPDAQFSGLPASMCIREGNMTLLPVMPGGAFSGPGVRGNVFDALVAGPGRHTITYSIELNTCRNAFTRNVDVFAIPDATFTGLSTTACTGDAPVNLNASTPGGIFTGGGVNGNQFDAAQAGPGIHTIQYTVDVNGCIGTWEQQFQVGVSPDASFSGLPDSTCAYSNDFPLAAVHSQGTFSGNGINGTAFVPSLAGPGAHWVTYEAVNGGCVSRDSRRVVVYALPDAEFTGLPSTACETEPVVHLVANTAGGSFSGIGISGSDFLPGQAGAGMHNVSYQVSDGRCQNMTTHVVLVSESLPASFSGPGTSLCSGDPYITLTPSHNGGSFSGQGVNGNQFWPSLAGAGTHTVTYTLQNGSCFTTHAENITVLSSPVVQLGNDTALCFGSAIVLNAGNAGSQYRWNTPAGLRSTQMIAASAEGTYRVNVTHNGCSTSDSIHVEIYEQPVAGFAWTSAGGLTCQFQDQSAGDVTAWSWDFGDGGTSAQRDPSHTWSQAGTYVVSLLATGPCGTTLFVQTLNVQEVSVNAGIEEAGIHVYPNPSRGEFTVLLDEASGNWSIRMLDLTGKLILQENETAGISASRNHKISVKDAAPGTYLLEVTTEKGKETVKLVIE